MSVLPHTKADETATWWYQQLEKAKGVHRNVSKRHYRPQLRAVLDLELPEIVIGSDPGGSEGQDSAPEHIEQVNILYIPRFVKWVQARAYDDTPEVRHPRFTQPDALFGDMVSELLKRVGDECGETEEWRSAVPDVCADGVFAVWYGIHADAVDAVGLDDATQSIGDLSERALHGASDSKPGQDHGDAAEVMEGQALDPLTVLGPQGEQIQQSLLAGAAAHKVAAAKEGKLPQDYRFSRAEVWCQHRQVGPATLWDHGCEDIADARWVARKFVQDLDVAKKNPAFNASVARTLEGGLKSEDPDDDNGTLHGEDDTGLNAMQVAIWEIWDRKYQERHYVAFGQEKFLEKDATNPYLDDRGRPLINQPDVGFVPVVIEAPTKPNLHSSHRPYGIPEAAPGWPLQRLAIKLASHNLDAVKKLATRMLEVDSSLAPSEIAALTSGVTGTIVKRPEEMRNSPRGAVEPINFGNVPGEMFQQFKVCEQELAMVLGWPISQMTGMPQADTATAEEISVTAGYDQMGDLIRRLEGAHARGQQIKRALIRQFYTPEQIIELIGDEHAEAYEEWKGSPLAGDRLQSTFAARTRSEDPVKIKQLQDALMLLMADVDPTTGLPMWETEHMKRQLVRMLGGGDLIKKRHTEQEIQLAMMARMGEQGEEAPGGPGGDAERSKAPASRGDIMGGTQKVGPLSRAQSRNKKSRRGSG